MVRILQTIPFQTSVVAVYFIECSFVRAIHIHLREDIANKTPCTDGRPDYAEISSNFRMQISVSAALSHVNNFMHPQVVIIDGSGNEELYFKKGIREKTNLLSITVIELPVNAGENLLWITRLDSGSLKGQ
jgi:hypothetical protein